jgi:4-hydroxybenzoyl-CoA thioesterase
MPAVPPATQWQLVVEFGDCDPAGIAFYPNFFRWYDASTRHFFSSRGVPPWRELERAEGIIGTPVVEATSRYLRPVSYGDIITVSTWVDEWRARSFVLRHALRHEGELCAEGREVRIFAARRGDDGTRIRALPVPQHIAALCR